MEKFVKFIPKRNEPRFIKFMRRIRRTFRKTALLYFVERYIIKPIIKGNLSVSYNEVLL